MNRNIKEPVRLRQKRLADGSTSLYLDIYYQGKRSYEFLKMYLNPEEGKNARSIRIQNEATMRAALSIKSQRILDITTGKFNIVKPEGRIKVTDFIMDFYEGRTNESTISVYRSMMHQVVAYSGDDAVLSDVDKDYILGYIKHLRSLINCGKLTTKTACVYCATFSAVLSYAVRKKLIPKNPFGDIERSDKIQPIQTERTYLTIDEVKLLANTDTKYKQTKAMFMFSCFCGLRISDIRSLRWGEIHEDTDGGGNKITRLIKIMQKTKEQVSMKLTDNATMWLPERGNKTDDDLVFTDAPSHKAINHHLETMMKAAHISKHVTFHCARHTFATMMLTMGADLYTTSKLLGHTNISTTQIYAKIVDKKKDDAIDLLGGIL